MWVLLAVTVATLAACCPLGWRGVTSGFGWVQEAVSHTPFTRHGPANTVAVLPFDSGDPFDKSGEAVADVINQELTRAAPELQVTAHSAATRYGSDPSFASAFLHVRWCVTGKIDKGQGGSSIRAELVDVRSLTVVWKHTYRTGDLRDVAMARDVAANVRRLVKER
jgi:TolB-like protein